MKKILYVDDSAMFCAMMSNALRMGGFEVATASKGADVMPLARSQVFDLIILDMVLPDTTGLELLKQLKAEEATKASAVVLLTARENADEVTEAMKNGALSHLIKYKTTPKSLLEQVKAWLK